MGQLTICRFKIKIADSTTVSNEQDLRGFRLVALHMPTAWDTSATVSFTARPGLARGDTADGNDAHQAVADSDGAALAISVAASKYVVFTTIEKDLVGGLAFAKLVAAGAQSVDREIIGVLQPRD